MNLWDLIEFVCKQISLAIHIWNLIHPGIDQSLMLNKENFFLQYITEGSFHMQGNINRGVTYLQMADWL